MQRAAASACREAAELVSAFEAELWASALLGSWWPRRAELGADDPDLELGGPLVEEIARRGGAGALAALIAVSEVSDAMLGELARRHAERLIAEGSPVPNWRESILKAHVHRTAVMREEIFDDGITVFIEATHGGEDRHALGVYIDNNLGRIAKDILLADSIDRVEELVLQNLPDDGELRIESIESAEACARIHAAIELTDLTFKPPVGEDYADLRSLALLRADELPGGNVDVTVPELSAERHDRLLAEFLASPEAEGIDSGDDRAEVVSLAIEFCSNYVDGQPLRWSPVVVELFMADWLPRKVVAGRGLFEAVPSALEAWVAYAGRQRGIPDWAIALTVEAIPEWVEEMLAGASDDGPENPARRLLAAAEAAGVDLTNERALAEFVAGWNERAHAVPPA